LIKEKEFPLEEKKAKQGIRSTLHVLLYIKEKFLEQLISLQLSLMFMENGKKWF